MQFTSKYDSRVVNYDRKVLYKIDHRLTRLDLTKEDEFLLFMCSEAVFNLGTCHYSVL